MPNIKNEIELEQAEAHFRDMPGEELRQFKIMLDHSPCPHHHWVEMVDREIKRRQQPSLN